MNTEERVLKQKLEKIGRLFNVTQIQKLKTDSKYIQDYYRVNRIAYSLFLPSADYIYVGVSRDGKFKKSDLLEAANAVSKYLQACNAKNVLELATGRGANSAYLAKLFPHIDFYGLDISNSQLSFAFKRTRHLINYHPAYGDYHDLQRYPESMFDVVFVVEALCYSTDKERVLREVRRVLQPGGIFIVVDGYLSRDPAALAHDERVAAVLAAHGMGLSAFEWYESFNRSIERTGFIKIFEEDVSRSTLPMLTRLERLAMKFFDHYFLARIIQSVTPRIFLYNAISGYLLPTLVHNGTFGYFITVLHKRNK